MNITNKTGLVGFLLVLSALSVPSTVQATTDRPATIEARLSRLSSAVRERVNQLPDPIEDPTLQALGWGNGGRGSFVNSSRPWRNGWADGGGFFNSRPSWLNGGGFVNSRPGGSFLNRR